MSRQVASEVAPFRTKPSQIVLTITQPSAFVFSFQRFLVPRSADKKPSMHDISTTSDMLIFSESAEQFLVLFSDR